MPPSPRSRMQAQSQPQSTTNNDNDAEGLRAYQFHGLELTIKENGRQGVGDCPLCGGTGKFTVEVLTSKFRCWSCGNSGNALTFIRVLHETSVSRTDSGFIKSVMADRGLTKPSTVTAWGVCKSVIPPNHWLLPGYDTEGKLTQLYKRTHIKGSDGVWSWALLPTPGVWEPGKVHAIHAPISDFDQSRKSVDVLEGPWDGMAYWEVVQSTPAAGDSNIIAVPGANVWRDDWNTICSGKDVTLWYDSDHPRALGGANTTGQMFQPGYDGVKRVSKKLSGHALSVSFVRWGPDGYDPDKKNGWDVRDALTSQPNRLDALSQLLPLIESVPADWFSSKHVTNGTSGSKQHNVESESCDNWAKCLAAWKDALEWRTELSDVMLTMFAVAASTNQSGDNQLFLRVIGDPGSAKTRLCKGLLVSKHCKQLLHLKSFHSGFKKPGDGGEDCSLVSRISGLCLVTPEADALTLGANSEQLDSQVRQIFDGESGNTYGNSDEDRQYKGLRSPWIQAGTPALMDKDQSRLGDRFLRIRIEQPSEEVKRLILLRALRNERRAVLETSNGTESSIIPPKLRKAYALTGGYVDWLRANVEDKISEVEANMDEDCENQCVDLGMLAAEMRARPNNDPKKVETFHTKELPTRLVSQLGRMALHLAVVMNKTRVDKEVMRIVRKIALDTAHGHSLNIVMWMCTRNPGRPELSYQETGGIQEKRLAAWCNMSDEKMVNYLSFLRKIEVTKCDFSLQGGNVWMLTDRIYDLYLKVMSR